LSRVSWKRRDDGDRGLPAKNLADSTISALIVAVAKGEFVFASEELLLLHEIRMQNRSINRISLD
jgi:hypothetical protein